MEENKSINEVKVQNNNEAAPLKLTYEQLENLAHQLSEQSKNLYRQLKEKDLHNAFARLEFLFRVLNHTDMFPEEFVKATISEIVDIMTIPNIEDSNEEHITEE